MKIVPKILNTVKRKSLAIGVVGASALAIVNSAGCFEKGELTREQREQPFRSLYDHRTTSGFVTTDYLSLYSPLLLLGLYLEPNALDIGVRRKDENDTSEEHPDK